MALKAFIIFRDRKTYGQRCVIALLKAGLEPVVVDHGSTWPPALDWLDDLVQDGITVLRREGGHHPRDLWNWEPFREACGTGRYIVTDPDVVPSDDCPGDWPARLGEALDRSGRPKAGLGLRLDRIPEHYQRREQVLSWEAQFWESPLDGGLFDAIIDTTLALYRPLPESPSFEVTAVRTGPPYVADHLAWYEDLGDLSPELRHYHEHADPGISYWTLPGRSVWGNLRRGAAQLSDNDLLVMVPTRGRRAQCERFLAAFTETATCTDLLFILDPDDDSYAGMDWGEAATAVLDPRDYLAGKLNKTALAMADLYPVLMWLGDDCVPETPAWDRIMLATLAELGGHGWVYPDDKRRNDVPEHWMVSSDVVKALGWFANPALGHFYIDNSVAELGKRAGLIRWCPEAVIRHEHYSVSRARRDRVYSQTEKKFGAADLAAFQEWRGDRASNEVSLLRRHFSKDVAWVLSKVA